MLFHEACLFTNLLTFGGIGSEKTACVIIPMLNAISEQYNDEDPKAVNAKWGGFVLDVHGDLQELLIQYLPNSS